MRLIIFFISLSLSYNFIFGNNIFIWSESAIMVDFQTEQILFEKNKDLIIPPASMTKLVSLYMVYREIEKGNVKKTDIVPISQNADYKNLPKDSSLMFIEQGQRVTLYELMLGLAIPSGNDAAIAIAEYLYGSEEKYLKEVELEMLRLGLNRLNFVDSSGFNDLNEITVNQFVEFCLLLVKKYPSILDDLLSLESFTYPKKVNGKTSIGSIYQTNHNPLINIYPNIDGLKTGFINKSGLNISITAKKGDRRVIGVLVGIKDDDKNRAQYKRIYDSVTLLNYSLDNFYNIPLDKIKLPNLEIISNSRKYITPIIPYKTIFTFNKDSTFIYNTKNLKAPINIGDPLGFVLIKENNSTYKYPIVSNEQIYK